MVTERVDGGHSARQRGRPRQRNRARYAFQEFLLLPLAIVGAGLILATGAIVLDRYAQSWGLAVQRSIAVLVPPQAASMLLSTVTTGLLTVISIIFFVMLMAVQHQPAIYSPVVLDQFLRRKINQTFFGMFIALTLYCLLALPLVPSGQAVVSGTLALVLITVTFGLLLMFIYSTVDQMRPSSVVWIIQHLALRARASQKRLLARCRTHPQLHDAPATEVISGRIGYLVHIDGDSLARSLNRAEDTVEIELLVAMGDHIVSGATVAVVRGHHAGERHRQGEAVLDALTLGRMRDIDRDAGHAVDHWPAWPGQPPPSPATPRARESRWKPCTAC